MVTSWIVHVAFYNTIFINIDPNLIKDPSKYWFILSNSMDLYHLIPTRSWKPLVFHDLNDMISGNKM